jgi:pSer/pThr/pTyr-binding forkhead associated (FHA) protein
METTNISFLPPKPPKISTRTVRLQHLKLALRADSGLQIGKLYVLREGRTIMGRAVDAEVPIDDAKASRLHAAIDWTSGFYQLSDLGSLNGTFLNGRTVQTAERLTVGDEIRIGSTCYRVEILEEAKSNISKSWVEPTKIIMIPQPGAQKIKNTIHISNEPSQSLRIEQTLKKFKEDRANFISRHGGWLGMLFVVIVVATALVST